MKQCPECRRVYKDESLNFCLDDGAWLDSTSVAPEEATAVLKDLTADTIRYPSSASNRLTGTKKLLLAAAVALICLAAGFVYYSYFDRSQPGHSEPSQPAADRAKPYWEMSEAEQIALINLRARYVQTLIGDDASDLDTEGLTAIKTEIDEYLKDRDSLSQKAFEEAPRVVYGRATQFAPTIIRAYEARRVPAALGLYQAVVESEYHDCPNIYPDEPSAPVGLFQFSRRTAAVYGMKPSDYCNVEKQADAAARYMSDLISDFGTEKSSWTLALASFNLGGEQVRELLRRLREHGVTERSYWAILRHQGDLGEPMNYEGSKYVPRFFAAAIIGETPSTFGLATPPLSTLRN